MDSFSVFFRDRLSDDEIRTAILATGASATCRAPGEIVASRDSAHAWVDSYLADDLPSREEWPVPRPDVGSVVLIAVSRNEGAAALAVEIAHRLATQLGGIISWDGNEYWRTLYDEAYQHRKGRV
jgi:hypothetical protein